MIFSYFFNLCFFQTLWGSLSDFLNQPLPASWNPRFWDLLWQDFFPQNRPWEGWHMEVLMLGKWGPFF